ncbi:hypothetical protein FRB90_001896 [Tulasnella sp. 427]|nr:hypothetical protein FRB90_001896 [Tulasnella sp. 427]
MVLTRSKASAKLKDFGDKEGRYPEKFRKGDPEQRLPHSQSNPRLKKKARTSRGQVGGKLNLSQSARDHFTSLPLDVIHEIFELLAPLDLLNLARTDTVLRSYLMSKRSIGIWKIARAATDPPVLHCPQGFSEPQLAVLLFTKECTICNKKVTKAQTPWWILQLRLCKACSDSHTPRMLYVDDTTRRLAQLISPLNIQSQSVDTVKYKFAQLPLENYCRIDELNRIADVVEDHQLRVQAKVERDSTEFEKFVKHCKSEVSARCESAKVLAQWFNQMTKARWKVEQEQREARKQAIVAKLLELGYEDRDIQRASVRYPFVRNLIRTTSSLTPGGWSRLQPLAERLVQDQQFRRLEMEEGQVQKDRRRAFRERLLTFKALHVDASVDPLMPSDKVVINVPVFRRALDAEGTVTTPDIFDEAFNELPGHLEDWKRERRIDLAKAVLKSRPGSEVDVDPEEAVHQGLLSLATSVFVTCGSGVLFNQDTDTIHWADSIGEHFAVKLLHVPLRNAKTRFPEIKCVHIVSEWVDHVKLLVRAVGLDPETATINEMDSLNARFYCDDCSCTKLINDPVARNWRNAVSVVARSLLV